MSHGLSDVILPDRTFLTLLYWAARIFVGFRPAVGVQCSISWRIHCSWAVFWRV